MTLTLIFEINVGLNIIIRDFSLFPSLYYTYVWGRMGGGWGLGEGEGEGTEWGGIKGQAGHPQRDAKFFVVPP